MGISCAYLWFKFLVGIGWLIFVLGFLMRRKLFYNWNGYEAHIKLKGLHLAKKAANDAYTDKWLQNPLFFCILFCLMMLWGEPFPDM